MMDRRPGESSNIDDLAFVGLQFYRGNSLTVFVSLNVVIVIPPAVASQFLLFSRLPRQTRIDSIPQPEKVIAIAGSDSTEKPIWARRSVSLSYREQQQSADPNHDQGPKIGVVRPRGRAQETCRSASFAQSNEPSTSSQSNPRERPFDFDSSLVT